MVSFYHSVVEKPDMYHICIQSFDNPALIHANFTRARLAPANEDGSTKTTVGQVGHGIHPWIRFDNLVFEDLIAIY
jgi:hypothetical protein